MTKPAAAALQQLVYKISLTCKDWALFNCTARKFSVHFQQLNNLGWLSYPSLTPAPYGWSSGSMLAKFWSSPFSTCKSVQIERTISGSTSTCKSPLSECQPAASIHSNLWKNVHLFENWLHRGGKKNSNIKQESLSETYVLFKIKSSCRGCFTMVKIELNATLTRLVEMTKGKGVVVKMVFPQIFLDGFGKTIGQIILEMLNKVLEQHMLG